MSSGLPKGYRFWGAESRDAASIYMYFCCIFGFAIFDFKAFFAPCPWRDSPLCAKHRKRPFAVAFTAGIFFCTLIRLLPLVASTFPRLGEGFFMTGFFLSVTDTKPMPPQAVIVPQGTYHLSPGQYHSPQGTSYHAKNACRSRRFLRGTSFYYSLPHCLPVKNRRVVVARNTLPARSTVEGNSG